MTGSSVQVVKADVGDGRVVAIEARNVDPERPVGIRDILKFDGVTSSIEAVAEQIGNALERVRPQRASVEFGVDVSVDSGVLTGLIAKGAGGATLKITMEWQRATHGGSDG